MLLAAIKRRGSKQTEEIGFDVVHDNRLERNRRITHFCRAVSGCYQVEVNKTEMEGNSRRAAAIVNPLVFTMPQACIRIACIGMICHQCGDARA